MVEVLVLADRHEEGNKEECGYQTVAMPLAVLLFVLHVVD